MTRPTIPNRVFGFYREQGKNKENDLTLYDGVWGDGNIYSSVEDLLKWDQALYGEKLLKQKTLREAFEPARLSDGTTYPYGFGWGILESGRVMHTGGWTGFRTMIMRDMAHNRTVIVLSNGSCDALDFRALGKLFIGAKMKVPHSTLIANVRVVDGTGLAGYAGAVRIMDNVIRETGNLQPFPNETVIDGKGMVLAPGFIDSHSHHDRGMEAQPDIVAALSQGITTVIVGQDGYGPRMDTLTAQFNRHPLAINIGSYTGHTTLRFAAMGPSGVLRTSTTQELEKMKTMMREEMDKGSLGISTGLEYESAFFSSRHEVLELAKVTAEEGGRYISHIRSEDINLSDALDEIIAIGREARLPVQVSHFKIALRDNWGTSRQLISQLENARASGVNITADVYPYDYWMSTLRVLFPKRDYQNPVSADFAVRQLFDPEGSVLVAFAANPSYAGKTVSEVARLRKESPATTLMWLVAEAEKYEKSNPDGDEDVEGIMGKSMLEEDVAQLTAWPHSNICSDGTTYGHPRGYGAFPRVFRMYVRERPVLTLEQAVYKMTGLTAEHLGLRDRGLIAPGQAADLVLFDPATISDQATIARPDALSTGVIKVWVNGTLTWNEGKAVGRSGKLIRK